MENPPKKFYRLSPGNEVRLRYGYFIKCVKVVKDLKTGEEMEVVMGENEPKTVKITPGVVHAIKNTGDKDMVLLVYVNEQFDPTDPDTIYKKILD